MLVGGTLPPQQISWRFTMKKISRIASTVVLANATAFVGTGRATAYWDCK